MPADVQELIDTLQKQLDTFGMTNQQLALYQANLRGATAAQLQLVDAQAKQLDQLQKQKTAAEDTRKRFEAVGGMAKTAVGTMGNLADATRGSFTSLGQAAQGVGQLVGAIPTPLGQAASAAIGLVGSAVQAMGADADKFRRQSVDAFMAAATGAKSFRAALAEVQVGQLSEGLRRATEALAGGGGFLQSAGMWAMRITPVLSGQQMAQVELNNSMEQAIRMEQAMQALQRDPTLQVGRRQLAVVQFHGQTLARQEAADQQAGGLRDRAAALRAGATTREAAQAEAEYRTVAQIAQMRRREGQTLEQAMQEVRADPGYAEGLRRQREAQRRLDAAQVAAEVTARTRTAGETFVAEQRQLVQARELGGLGETAFYREQGAMFRALAGAGDFARLPQLLEEGSVAAAQAVQAAEREQAAADPREVPNILRSMEELGRQQVDYGRRVAQALEELEQNWEAGGVDISP